MEFILFLVIGAVAGFAAGLFGVGGGIIIVPLLFLLFSQMDYNPNEIMHLALGTSHATIIVTSISSLMAHHKNAAVIWSLFRNLAPFMAIGCFFGAKFAGLLSGLHLQMILGVFLMWVAYTLFQGRKNVIVSIKSLPNSCQQSVAGSVIGFASAIFGIGGGSLTVPYLTHYGVVMLHAVGTSAACGLPISIAGALGFMIFGIQNTVSSPNTFGYIHIYAFLGIGVMSFFTAKLGANTANNLSPIMLKKCFALLLMAVGSFFLLKGIF